MQSTFYPTIAQTYGVPLDTRDVYTKCTSITLSLVLLSVFKKLTTISSGLANVDRSHSIPIHTINVHLPAREVD
jgi:hypothetical protein